MITQGRLVDARGNTITLELPGDVWREVIRKDVREVEVRLNDGRSISVEQRRKAYALIRDIAKWSGDDPECIKEFLKFGFCEQSQLEWFSLSDCDMTTAREYISYLIEFCLRWDVPCMDALLNRTDDIDRYLYACLYYRKCCITGKPAEIHHVNKIGMGRDREHIVHVGLLAMALSREWHNRVHQQGEAEIFERYHIYGVKLDEILCRRWKLGRKKDA